MTLQYVCIRYETQRTILYRNTIETKENRVQNARHRIVESFAHTTIADRDFQSK